MKKGKSRNKRKKTRSRPLWIAIAVIGIAAVTAAVCVAGMLAIKENTWRTPEREPLGRLLSREVHRTHRWG